MFHNPMLPTFPATPITPEPIFTILDDQTVPEMEMNPYLTLELTYTPTFMNVGTNALKDTLRTGAPIVPAIARLPHAMRCPTWPHRLMRKAALVAVMIVAGWSADQALADQKDAKAPVGQKAPAIAAKIKPQAALPLASARAIPAAPLAKAVPSAKPAPAAVAKTIQAPRPAAPQPQRVERNEHGLADARNDRNDRDGRNDRDNRVDSNNIARQPQPIIARPVETRREQSSIVIGGSVVIGRPGPSGHDRHDDHRDHRDHRDHPRFDDRPHFDRRPIIHHPLPRVDHVIIVGRGHDVRPPVPVAPICVDGWTLLRDGHDLAAMNAFSDQMRHQPADATLRVGYAVAAALAGQDAAAAASLRAAMACDPNILARIRLESCLTIRLAYTVDRLADDVQRGCGRPDDRFVIAALQYLRYDYRSAYRVANNAIYYGDHHASTHQVRDLALQALVDHRH